MPVGTIPVAQPGFLDTLFAPLPEKKGVTKDTVKDTFDYAAGYVQKSPGSWDFFRAFREPLYYFSRCSFLGEAGKTLVDKGVHVLTAAGTALSLPKLISDTNSLRKSVNEAQIASKTPYSDPLRKQRMVQANKNVFCNATGLVNTTCEAGLFLHHVGLVALNALRFSIFDGVYNATNIILDGVDLASQVYKLKQFEDLTLKVRKNSEKTALENKKTLAWITVVQDVSSIAASSIYLVAIVFSIALESVPLAPWLLLGLGSSWLISKISCGYYEEMVVNAPPPGRIKV